MIDNFALALSHGLILLAIWRLMFRADLDDDTAPEPEPPARLEKKFGLKRDSTPGA